MSFPEFVSITYVFDFDPGVGAPAAFINMSLPKIGHDMIMGLARGAEATVAATVATATTAAATMEK